MFGRCKEGDGSQHAAACTSFLLPPLGFWVWWDWQVGCIWKETKINTTKREVGGTKVLDRVEGFELLTFKTVSATFPLTQLGQAAPCFCTSVSPFVRPGGEGSARTEEWRLIPEQTKHIKMIWNVLQHCHIGDEHGSFKMPHQHYILSIKCNYSQEKWSRANWQSLYWFDISPTSKERRTFSKHLLISVTHLSV